MSLLLKLYDSRVIALESGTIETPRREGDRVDLLDPLCGLSNELGGLQITSPVSGKVRKSFVNEGQQVERGDVLFVIHKDTAEKPRSTRRGFVFASYNGDDTTPPTQTESLIIETIQFDPPRSDFVPPDPVIADDLINEIANDPTETAILDQLGGNETGLLLPDLTQEIEVLPPDDWNGKLRGTRTYSVVRPQEWAIDQLADQMEKIQIRSSGSELVQTAMHLFLSLPSELQIALLYEYREALKVILESDKWLVNVPLVNESPPPPIPNGANKKGTSRRKK